MVETLSPKKHTSKQRPDLRVLSKDDNLSSADDLVLAFAGKLAGYENQISDICALMKKERQRAMNAGLVMEDVEEARDLAAMEPEKATQKLERILRYTRALGQPVGGLQLTLFADERKATLSREELMSKAFEAGKALALLGKNPDYQAYPKDSDLGQEHLKGWYAGQDRLKELFVELNEKETAAEAAKVKEKADKEATRAQKKQEREAKKKSAAEEKAAKPKGQKGADAKKDGPAKPAKAAKAPKKGPSASASAH